MARIRWIRKRDSRQVPFDPSKIADAIFQAVQSTGEGDRQLAVELAGAVTLHLEQHHGKAVPGIEDIQDMVERVLIETGHANTAKAYILYRDERARLRETLRVRRQMETGEFDVSDHLRVARGGGEQVEGWSKGRIAAALVREAGLEADIAAAVARSVEKKVFASGVKNISTGLIRELVDNELFERGLEASLRRQAQVGIPKYDLEGIILEGGKDVAALSARIGNRILRAFTLEKAYSPEVSEAHREGSIHIHGLDSPLSILDVTMRPPADGALQVLMAADAAVSRSVHVEASEMDPGVYAHLRGDWVRRPDGGLYLHLPPDRLGEIPHGCEATVVLELHEEDTEALRTAADLISRGRSVALRWNPSPLENTAVLHEITLNLPRAARKAGSGNFTSFLEEAHSLISLAYKGFQELYRFVDRVRGRRSPALPLAGARQIRRLSVVGLADAIGGVTGADPALGGKALDLHLEAIGSLRSAAEDLEDLGGVRITPGGTSPQPAAQRFARIDLATRQGYPRPSPSPSYANGFHLGPESPVPLPDRIAREREITRAAGFGDLVVPRLDHGPPSAEEILDLLLQTRGYEGTVRFAGVFLPVPEE